MASVDDSGIEPSPHAGGDGDPDPRFPSWIYSLRNLLFTCLGSLSTSLVLRQFEAIPETFIVRLCSFVTFLAAFAYAMRSEIHIEGIRLYGHSGWPHLLVVGLEIPVALAFLACGPYCFLHPDGSVQFLFSAGLVCAVFVLALAMTWVVRTAPARTGAEMKTGTDIAPYCWLNRFLVFAVLEPVDYLKPAKWLIGRWELAAPKNRVSYLTIWLCGALVAVACANGPRVAPDVYAVLSGQVKVTVVEKKSGDQGRHDDSAPHPDGVPDPGAPAPGLAIASRPAGEEVALGYRELCGRLTPGAPAPQPARDKLHTQWLAGGLGAVVAGCARPAHQEPNGLWFAPGRCGTDLRSLAVAAPDEKRGAIVVWAPARFAFARALDGTLTGATSSQLVGPGEVYSVETVSGTYTFMRDHLSDGEALAGEPLRCDELEESAVKYVPLPPALSRLWSAQVQFEGMWIWPVGTEPGPEGGERYLFDDPEPGGSREIVGFCRAPTDCELRVEGVTMTSTGSGAIDLDVPLEYAPPPA